LRIGARNSSTHPTGQRACRRPANFIVDGQPQARLQPFTFSPHTRGWPGSVNLYFTTARGSPRTRGDGPEVRRRSRSPLGVLPAHAGMARARYEAADLPAWFSPHTRGWPGREGVASRQLIRSPRTRGDGPGLTTNEKRCIRVLPAHAGMARPRPCASCRPSGVLPAHAGMVRTSQSRPTSPPSFSPHTRGWLDFQLAVISLLQRSSRTARVPASPGGDGISGDSASSQRLRRSDLRLACCRRHPVVSCACLYGFPPQALG